MSNQTQNVIVDLQLCLDVCVISSSTATVVALSPQAQAKCPRFTPLVGRLEICKIFWKQRELGHVPGMRGLCSLIGETGLGRRLFSFPLSPPNPCQLRYSGPAGIKTWKKCPSDGPKLAYLRFSPLEQGSTWEQMPAGLAVPGPTVSANTTVESITIASQSASALTACA